MSQYAAAVHREPQHLTRPHVRHASSHSTQKMSIPWRLWYGVVHTAGRFFFAAGGEQSDDHLVEVVRREPAAATQFIQSIALFSSLGNVVVVIASATFLSMYWSRCGSCDRSLRWWLLLQGILQLSQLPVRVVLLLSVRAVDRAGGNIEACIASLTASPAWKISKTVAMLQYGWFVLGLVWWMHSESCPSCPGIGKLTAAIMALSAARAGAALAAFRLVLTRQEPEAEEPKVMAATPSQISALPVERYVLALSEDVRLPVPYV